MANLVWPWLVRRSASRLAAALSGSSDRAPTFPGSIHSGSSQRGLAVTRPRETLRCRDRTMGNNDSAFDRAEYLTRDAHVAWGKPLGAQQ